MTKLQIHVVPPHPVYKPGDRHYTFHAHVGRITVVGESEAAALTALATALTAAAAEVKIAASKVRS